MTRIHIYSPPSTPYALVTHCPTCERLRRMFGRAYEWHEATVTCAGCGDTWHGAEMQERPFAPGWRPKSIAVARAGLAALGVPA